MPLKHHFVLKSAISGGWKEKLHFSNIKGEITFFCSFRWDQAKSTSIVEEHHDDLRVWNIHILAHVQDQAKYKHGRQSFKFVVNWYRKRSKC